MGAWNEFKKKAAAEKERQTIAAIGKATAKAKADSWYAEDPTTEDLIASASAAKKLRPQEEFEPTASDLMVAGAAAKRLRSDDTPTAYDLVVAGQAAKTARQGRLDELRKQYQQATVDMDMGAANRLKDQINYLQKHLEQRASDRVKNTASGMGKTYAGGVVGAAATVYEKGTEDTLTMRDEYKLQYDQAKRSYQSMLAENKEKPGSWSGDDIAFYKNRMEELQEKLKSPAVEVFDKEKQAQITERLWILANDLTTYGSKDIEKAKAGTTGVGSFAVDAAVGIGQLGVDAALGAVTGGAMVPMALRSFGGGALEARAAGASLDQQIIYGLASASVELLTEKISSVGRFQNKVFGAGAIDNMATGAIAALERLGKTETGRAILNRVATAGASFLSEGFEEGFSAVVDPVLKNLIYTDGEKISLADVGYEALVGGVIGAVTGGIGGTNTSDVQVGHSVRTNGMLSDVVQRALRTNKDGDAYKTADEIRSRKAPATDEEIGQLTKMTVRQEISEALQAAEAVEKAQAVRYDKTVETTEVTVENKAASLYAQLGMKLKKAEAKAAVVQKLIDGKEVTRGELLSLNLSDAKYQAIFTELTGVTFEKGMNDDQRFNAARTAHEVRKSVVSEPQMVQESVIPDEVAAEVPAAADPVVAESEDRLPTFEEFEAWASTRTDSSASPEATRAAYDAFVARENETAIDDAGIEYTRHQFRNKMQAENPELSNEAADSYFDKMREVNTNKSRHSDLRHKLSKEVQDVISTLEKKLGIQIEVTDDIYVEKAGKFAEGEASGRSIRLALNARGDLSYDEAVMQVLRHELTHRLKKAVSKETYSAFAQYVREFDSDFYQKQYASVKKTYEKQFADTEDASVLNEQIEDEVIARCAEKLFGDAEFARMVTGRNRTLAEVIHDTFEKLLRKLKLTGKARDQLQAKRDLWATMLNEAEANAKKGEIKQGRETTVVDGKQYSYKSMSHDIREGTMYADLVKPQTLAMLDMKKSDIDKLFRQLNSLLKYMEPNLKILDYNEEYTKDDRPYHPYKQNSDPLYKISLDFSTMCTKRLLMQHIIERLQVMEQKPMSAARQMAIREKIKQYAEIEKGLQVACAMCYVESARLHSPEQVQHYLDDPGKIVAKHFSFKNKEFNAAVKEMQTEIKRKHGFNPNASKGQLSKAAKEEFRTRTDEMRENYKPSPEEQAIVDTANSLPVETYLTAENLTALSREHPEIYDAFTTYIRNATRSKSTQTPVPYYYGDSKSGDVTVSDSFIESMNAENGMRFSSWSDYMFKHVLDMMTAVIELSVRGSSMHGYTKFPQFVRVFGKTGMMFNLSGVADGMGLDENGKLVFSDSESVDITEARKVRNLYPETAGVQCIGVSDDHIRKLMATDWIDYIIPYHVSGMSAALRRLAGIAGWSDYSDVQHAKPDPKAAKHGKEPVFSEFFVADNPGDGLDCMRKSAEKYKQLCRERGLIPKFSDFADDPNYWKLLIDRKMINQRTGALIFQKPVKPIFNFREIRKQVRQEVANYDPEREQRVFDYIVANMDDVEAIAQNVQAEMNAGSKGRAKGAAAKAVELGNEMTATAINGDGQSQYSFGEEDGFASSTNRRYNETARRFQSRFTGHVDCDWIVDLSNREKAAVGSALKTGNARLDANGNRGRVNLFGNCYMFEVLKSGGVYVTDVVDADEFNIHNTVIGGVYDEEENRASGSTVEGARDRSGHSPERISAGAKRGSKGTNDSLVGAEPDSNPRRDQPEVERRSESQPGEVSQYSFADEFEGTNPDLAYLPWADQVDLALTGKLNDILRSDGYTEQGTRLNSVLYVAKEPTALLQETGLSDLPLILTQQHLRNIVGKRWGAKGRVINAHNHELPAELVKKIPEYIRHPIAVFKSEGAQTGGLVLLTPEMDAHGDPVCVFIKPDQPSFTYDGVNGPAHFVNVYGLENFNQFLQNAINNGGVIYVDGKKMGQHPAVRDTLNKGASSGEGLTSAYDTIVRSKDPTVKPGERKFSLADDLTPELREEFVKSFDAQFGEGAAEAMFKTHDQMVRAARRAKVKAKTTEESAAAERALAQRRRENAMLAWEIHHKKTLREQQRKYNDALAKERKAKAEAVADTKQVEQAKADIRVQATEMNLGKKAAEKERTLKDRMVEQKEKAAERLRITKDAYKGRMAERTKLQRTAAKRLLSDKKAVEKRKAEIEAQQGPVDTIRKNPRERANVEKLKAMAEELRTRGRTAYRYFVNQAQEIDNFAKRQRGGVYASTLVNVLGGSGSTVETIFKDGLVDRAGNRIAGSLKEVLLCMDATGKRVDEAKQALLQDYILHLHNIDRMSFVANARTRLDAFESKPENHWLVGLEPKELAILVAATDAETADAIFKKNGKVKGNKGWTDADRQLAWEYASLLNAYREAQDKPVFADENGNPVTAETSREIVAKYEADHPWLVDKANGVFEWWDLFMRTWAVGDSLSLAEYETMHQTYPHYAPTYRVDKAGPGGAASISGRAATVSKATKAAKGSTLEIVPIEDSFANIASKIVRMARVNELYMNIIDTAMLDDEGLFSDMAVFDWDWQMGAYEQALQIQAMLNGETAAEIENASKVGLEKDGANYKLTGWKDGRKYIAYISQDLYQSIADTTGATDEKLKTLTQLGNTLTGPMKTAITGVNPFFAIRNLSRDIPSAIINSTGGKFPKYWAKAISEMQSNSENWQAFKALGGINAGYYNNEKGFVDAMSRRPGVVSTAIDALGTVNNITEAATRFAEYLSTIDRMGDTYEARLQGIKNSAEVTVDFSRKGSYGKFINAWVPYWNPAVQGIDKMFRSVIDSPDGSAVWKQATKTLSRAALCTVLTEAVLQAVLHGLDRDDEWEELSDRDKATYYCIPLPNEHKFLKIAKNREWGAILGTPFMLILEGLDGRQNPFENYVETSLEPNFMPGAILRPREGGGFTSDIIGVSQALDLAYNEDFAGRTIVPYAQQQGSLTEQYDSETSMFSRVLGDLFNFSPMQLDYIIQDYFGDFGDVFTNLTAPATWSADSSPADTAASAWDTFTSSFFADNRYSNQTVSNYYETLDELSKVVNDKKNQMGTEAHKQTKEYKTQKGLQELYGNQITELNKEVRGLPDGPDKDALKEQIAQLAGQALEFYEESMSGGISEPLLTATYANLPSSVSNELIRLDNFAADYSFEPSTYKPTKYTDPKDKSREYVLDDDAKAQYRTIYDATYAEVMEEAMGKHSYQKANDQKKVEMLEEARDSVTELTKERFLDWLADNRRSTEKTK